MNKLALCSLLYTCLAFNVHASSFQEKAILFYKAKLPFSSIILIKQHMVKGRPFNQSLEKIVLNVLINYGNSLFLDLDEKILRNYPDSSVVNFILASKLFKEERFKETLRVMGRVPNTHPLAVEKSFMLGAVRGLMGQYSRAYRYYERCGKYAEEKRDSTKKLIWKRYYSVLLENCSIHKARLLYEQGKYNDSLAIYRMIPKTSYSWPYILLEKAWNNFQIKNYNRALGLSATYKSPLLEDYFSPESDYLRGLSYMRLCYWQDTADVVDEYQKKYMRNAKRLHYLLKKYKSSNSFFIGAYLKMIKKKKIAREGHKRSFVEGLMFRSKKKVKFNLDLKAYYALRKEITNISRISMSKNVVKFLKYNLKKMALIKIYTLNNSIKREMSKFLSDAYKFSKEIAKINLNLVSRERKSLYAPSKKKKRKKKVLRTIGSLDNVKRGRLQHFYSFDGEFWADELGEYSFGLKSKCAAKRGKR